MSRFARSDCDTVTVFMGLPNTRNPCYYSANVFEQRFALLLKIDFVT